MGYINFLLARSKGLTLCEISLLQIISQNKSEDHASTIEKFPEEIEKFDAQGLTTYIKGTAKSSAASKIRLSDKGARILEEIQTPEVTEDDLDVYTWLEKKYKEQGKEIGNAKKTKSLIAHFRANSGIERNHLVFLCKVFMNDEKEMEYSQRLEYLFWKREHLYQIKFDINQSRLYQYYLMNKEAFDAKFAQIQN